LTKPNSRAMESPSPRRASATVLRERDAFRAALASFSFSPPDSRSRLDAVRLATTCSTSAQGLPAAAPRVRSPAAEERALERVEATRVAETPAEDSAEQRETLARARVRVLRARARVRVPRARA
jgi:hypothetical protein